MVAWTVPVIDAVSVFSVCVAATGAELMTAVLYVDAVAEASLTHTRSVHTAPMGTVQLTGLHVTRGTGPPCNTFTHKGIVCAGLQTLPVTSTLHTVK